MCGRTRRLVGCAGRPDFPAGVPAARNAFPDRRTALRAADRRPGARDQGHSRAAEPAPVRPAPERAIVDGAGLPGMQHKYAETVLYFPARARRVTRNCTYCFRWAQFVGDAELKFAAPDRPADQVSQQRPGVSDVLLTGGDPMVMSAERLRSHVAPILAVVRGHDPDRHPLGRLLADRFNHRPRRGRRAPVVRAIVASGRTLAGDGALLAPA